MASEEAGRVLLNGREVRFILAKRNMSLKQLRVRLRVDRKHLWRLLEQRRPVTDVMQTRFTAVFRGRGYSWERLFVFQGES